MWKKVSTLLMVLTIVGCLLAPLAFGAEEGAAATSSFKTKEIIAIAAGIGIAIAAFGGALGQGRASSAALEGIARNPGASGKIFVPMLLALAFVESLVIFSWVIEFLLLQKL
jgi:F-type H+-transporting ATPase subunit c